MLRLSPILWLFLLAVPVALAQPNGEGVGAGPEPPASTAPAMPPEPMAQPQPTMSGPQMVEQGREYRKEIETVRAHIQGQVEAAKQDKDVIRLNCLLDKLSQLGANEKIMDQTLQILQEAVMRRDESAQLHEYTRITIIHQKAQVLRTVADACVGAETNYVGPTKVVTETPAWLPEGVDQPAPPTPPFSGIDRPIATSPFR
jgi:hypothetical protein